MLESVKRGDIRGMSFAFATEKDHWEHDDKDNYRRTIVKVSRLYDVSLVVTPAYSATSVETKGLDELKAKNFSTSTRGLLLEPGTTISYATIFINPQNFKKR